LTSFIDKGNNRFAGKDLPDDLISALYWACYITEYDVLVENAKVSAEIEDDEGWGLLSDVNEITGFEDNFDWMNDLHF
jgi:organic hydroperoxide reductase OsmC/OhrA